VKIFTKLADQGYWQEIFKGGKSPDHMIVFSQGMNLGDMSDVEFCHRQLGRARLPDDDACDGEKVRDFRVQIQLQGNFALQQLPQKGNRQLFHPMLPQS